MTSEPVVLSQLENGVLTLTLNRPKANAFNFEMIAALQNAFKQAARDSQTRCVLLKGSGSIFSAGQDVKEFGKAAEAEGSLSFRAHLQRTYNPLIVQIRQLEKPVLAAIGGAVAGAALGVALACDLRIATPETRFMVGFSGIGLAPDSGVSLFLPALIGLGRAAEFAYLNQPISAEQALQWGLVNRLAPAAQLEEQATQWARELAEGPMHAIGITKRAFNKSMYPNLEQILDYEGHLQEIAGHGPDHAEGLQAFLEKRPPQYRKS